MVATVSIADSTTADTTSSSKTSAEAWSTHVNCDAVTRSSITSGCKKAIAKQLAEVTTAVPDNLATTVAVTL
jgi:hypothetical protein